MWKLYRICYVEVERATKHVTPASKEVESRCILESVVSIPSLAYMWAFPECMGDNFHSVIIVEGAISIFLHHVMQGTYWDAPNKN